MHFEIKKSILAVRKGQSWWYILIGGNGECMMASEMMSSKQACKDSIQSIRETLWTHTKVIDTTL